MRISRLWLRRRNARAWFDQHALAFGQRDAGRISADVWWAERVEATWGLIARGQEAVPYAIKMLESRNADVREDGAGILAEIGRDERTVDRVLAALRTETEHQPRDVLIDALGRMKSLQAIPYLAEVIRSSETDGDTRSGAVVALGRIVGRRFDRQADAEHAALEWLDEHVH